MNGTHTFKIAGGPACLNAGMQDGKIAGKQDWRRIEKRERLTSECPAPLIDGLIEQVQERKNDGNPA
ncbi:hypothetical protein [Sphingobacterium kyonggiense]